MPSHSKDSPHPVTVRGRDMKVWGVIPAPELTVGWSDLITKIECKFNFFSILLPLPLFHSYQSQDHTLISDPQTNVLFNLLSREPTLLQLMERIGETEGFGSSPLANHSILLTVPKACSSPFSWLCIGCFLCPRFSTLWLNSHSFLETFMNANSVYPSLICWGKLIPPLWFPRFCYMPVLYVQYTLHLIPLTCLCVTLPCLIVYSLEV